MEWIEPIKSPKRECRCKPSAFQNVYKTISVLPRGQKFGLKIKYVPRPELMIHYN